MAGTSGQEKIRRSMVVSPTGYCYSSDVSSSNPNQAPHHVMSQLQSFESNPEIYNLTTGMELIGFPPKIQQQSHHDINSVSHDTNSVFWKGSSSKSINDPTMASDFYHQQQQQYDQNRLLVDESSLRCVFPCEANERPSQGLSLSLSSNNPSTIGLQSFELRQQQDHQGYFGKSMNIQQEMIQNNPPHYHHHQSSSPQLQIRSSKYLIPAQELLNEFCNLGTKQSADHSPKMKLHKTSQWQDESNNATSSSSKKQSLYSLEFLELQKRKTKLLQMLEEVDRRYKHYCDQMKAVVSSFEAVAGNGAATVYSALASKAMSRHFRCLRDGIVGQIKATKKAMGEKDISAPGTTRGETPRLRLLDQTLRQQRAFQQMSIMESHPWRPQRGLPERSVSVLRAWLFEHFLHPYPSDVDKHILARQTGLSRSQVSNWFINARVRLWKPMVEEMYNEETKDHLDNIEGSSDGFTGIDQENQNPHMRSDQDHKPTADQLVRIDSECLSSIINNPDKNEAGTKNIAKTLHNDSHHEFHQGFARVTDSFGAVELDFSSYNHHSASAVSYENAHNSFGGGGSGGGVSLTLGLQQHGGGGVSLAFTPTSQGSLFYPRDHIEDCQTVQYSLLDGDQGQNLPYRNLMGAQLLHDLAG